VDSIVSQSLDDSAAAALAAHRERAAALARRAAAIRVLPQDERDAAYINLAADLYGERVQWIAGLGFSLDTADGVTRVKIALGDGQCVRLYPDEANRAVTALLGLTLAATARP
jgi:hypothetical protein